MMTEVETVVMMSFLSLCPPQIHRDVCDVRGRRKPSPGTSSFSLFFSLSGGDGAFFELHARRSCCSFFFIVVAIITTSLFLSWCQGHSCLASVCRTLL